MRVSESHVVKHSVFDMNHSIDPVETCLTEGGGEGRGRRGEGGEEGEGGGEGREPQLSLCSHIY